MSAVLNWFSKPAKSSLPEPTALQALRAKQIEQLRTISELQRDVEYRVFVSDVLALYILLPPNFPQDRPIVRVNPAALHPWIDDQMVVTGCSSLNNFVVHSNLGKVVKEIVDEFRRNPPVILPAAACAMSSAWPSSASSLAPASFINSTHSISSLPSGSQPFTSVMPQYDMNYTAVDQPVDMSGPACNELKDLSMSELKELLENEDKFEQILKPRLDELRAIQRDGLLRIEKLANENIAKKTLMEERKRLLLEKYESLNDVRRKFDDQIQRQDELQQRYNLTSIQDNLKVAALQSEEKAEQIAERFLDGSTAAEEFHKAYMAERMVCHMRHAKVDKLTQLMRQRLRPS